MRYLTLPIMAIALTFVGTDIASANNGHHNRGHHASWSWGKHQPCATDVHEVPELNGSALPAALTLLAGASVVVMNRRRADKTA